MPDADDDPTIGTLCRDCLHREAATADRCGVCASPRLIRHAELFDLSIAHLDCDAFYAAVEKRDNPELADQPVIIGGGQRGVVSTCCYIARLYGVRSAMPMFKALKACPHAVVLKPDMARYKAVGEEVRALMLDLTPLVEPLSIDEAFLDLSGTEAVHGRTPAESLIVLQRRIEAEIGITASVGLSYNKFLAKVASDLDKPRGFTVIGRGEAEAFLADQPVRLIWGVGPSLSAKLEAAGFATIGDLRRAPEADLTTRFGSIGRRLSRFSRGEDDRAVKPDRPTKSISAETTFDQDVADPAELKRRLWPHCETVARRLARAGLAAQTVSLKLRTADFRIVSRSRRLSQPTQLAEVLNRMATRLVDDVADGQTAFRLIGVGGDDLVDGARADLPDLLDQRAPRAAALARGMEALEARFRSAAVRRGHALESPDGAQQSGAGSGSAETS